MKPLFISAGLLFAGASAHAAVSVDFESGPSQLRGGFNAANYTNTANGAGDDFLSFTQGSSASTVYYDANGATAGYSVFSVSMGSPLTVSANVTLSTANGSFGIFFGSPDSTTGNSFLALLNVDGSSPPVPGDDQFRFDNAFNASSGNVSGGLGGGSILGNPATFANAGVSPGNEFSISSTYTILSGSSYSISLTAGTVTATRTYTGVTPLTSVEVGFRTNPIAGGSGTLDDIAINKDPVTVPEPSTGLAALLGAAGILVLRQRQRC